MAVDLLAQAVVVRLGMDLCWKSCASLTEISLFEDKEVPLFVWKNIEFYCLN